MWVKLDDGVMFHRKTVAAGKDYCSAFTLWTAGLCYANRYVTDGQIPKEVLTALLPPAAMAPRKVRRVASLLCSTGRWIDRDDHYLIVGYEDEQREALSVSIRNRKRSQNDRKTRQRESNKNIGLANDVTRDSRARVPGPARSDPIRSDLSPPESPPAGGGPPPEQALLLTPTPKRRRRQTELAGETPEQITWRAWRDEYAAAYRGSAYVQSPADSRVVAALAETAKAHSVPRCNQNDMVALRTEIEHIIRHWAKRYLADDGYQNYLRTHCHPLRMIHKDLPRYGLPWDMPRKSNIYRVDNPNGRPELQEIV